MMTSFQSHFIFLNPVLVPLTFQDESWEDLYTKYISII